MLFQTYLSRLCMHNMIQVCAFFISDSLNSGEVDTASIVGAVQFLSRNVSQILLGFTPTTCQSQDCFAKLNMLTCVYVLMHSCEFFLCMKKVDVYILEPLWLYLYLPLSPYINMGPNSLPTLLANICEAV